MKIKWGKMGTVTDVPKFTIRDDYSPDVEGLTADSTHAVVATQTANGPLFGPVFHASWPLRISLFCRECLDVRFVILGKGNPNRERLSIDRNAVRTRGARQRRQRREFVIEARNGEIVESCA